MSAPTPPFLPPHSFFARSSNGVLDQGTCISKSFSTVRTNGLVLAAACGLLDATICVWMVGNALDAVVAAGSPSIVAAVVEELDRRDGMRIALRGWLSSRFLQHFNPRRLGIV